MTQDGVPPDDTAPCIGCGLCCDGTLYDRAKVAEGEEGTLVALGLELEKTSERTYFRQPCKFHSCGQCTNYQDRWAVCRSFRCSLLRRYQSGELGLDEARATVETALRLRAAVTAADQPAAVVGHRRRLRRALAADLKRDASGGDSIGRRLINIIALDTLLEQQFRNRKADPISPVEKPSGDG